MVKAKGLVRKGPSALSAVVAAIAAAGVSLLVISNCSGVHASSSASFKGGLKGAPVLSHGDDVDGISQPGRLRAEEEGQTATVSNSGRTLAHKRSSSSSFAASSLSRKSLGSVFLAISALAAMMSLFRVEGRHGGSLRKGGEEEGDVEELLREGTAAAAVGATSSAGMAAGLPKSLLSKKAVLGVTALGLLFLASSLATPSVSKWAETEVKMRYQCTTGTLSKCTLSLYPQTKDAVKHVYRKINGTEFTFVFPPEYKNYLGERPVEDFIQDTAFEKFIAEGKHMTECSGEMEVRAPLPPGFSRHVFSENRPTTWGSHEVTLQYECRGHGCTMTFPNSGKNAATRRISMIDPRQHRRYPFMVNLPAAFAVKTKELASGNFGDFLIREGRKVLEEWRRFGGRYRKGSLRVNFPIPPSLTPEIFVEQP